MRHPVDRVRAEGRYARVEDNKQLRDDGNFNILLHHKYISNGRTRMNMIAGLTSRRVILCSVPGLHIETRLQTDEQFYG